MANQEYSYYWNPPQLDILRQGVQVWNLWRIQHLEIKEPDLRRTDLRRANLTEAYLSGADLNEANLSDAHLNGADLRAAYLISANLISADLSGAQLNGAHLSYATLRRANLTEAHLIRADLSDAHLNDADLRGAHLRGADLIRADLSGVNLTKADLSGVNLTKADLSGVNLTKADLSGVNLTKADLSGVNLSDADLSNSVLVETNLTGATLTRCSIYGIAAWNVKLEGATQDSLVITPHGEPAITVDNLKVAQFIYLLLNNQELRDVLNAVTERGVLLLGRFSDGGLEMLQVLASELRKMKYLPILFDFDRPDSRDYTETIKTLVGLARFVIVDLSGPSVPQELYATVPHFDIPFVPIIEEGRKAHSMFRDLLKYPWVFPPVTFRDKEQLMELLPSRIIEPAEKNCRERQTLLNQLFHH
jgi:uncharacterized protein YjbI with pentapeptide repeats